MSHRTSHGKELPVPAVSAKIAAALSNTYEYACIWTGQSNSLPWGDPNDAFAFSLELTLHPPGVDIASIVVPANPDRAVDVVEELIADASVLPWLWDKSTWLRFGTTTAPELGYAEVVQSELALLTVRWISLPEVLSSTVTFDPVGDTVDGWTAHGLIAGTGVVFTTDDTLPVGLNPGVTYYVRNPTADDFQLSATPVGALIDLADAGTGTHTAYGSATRAGYLVREDGKFASYENCRVLTPYLPWRDIGPPIEGNPLLPSTTWVAPHHSAYPVPDGPVGADGKRLTLPAGSIGSVGPWVLPSAVTTFDDLAVYLPMTRREGADGFGISEIADSTFDGVGAPVGHPIESITGEQFTYANAISLTSDLTRAYVLVDWAVAGAGGASRRSWSRVVSDDPGSQTFTTDGTWLGDGIPPTPKGDSVTFGAGSATVTWDATGGSPANDFDQFFQEGDRIFFKDVGLGRLPDLGSATVTFDLGNDEVDWVAHPFSDDDPVAFSTTATLPTPLAADTTYYVVNAATDTFQVALTQGGTAIDLGGAPAGTHTAYQIALTPYRIYYVRNISTNTFEVAQSPDHPVITFVGAGDPGVGIQGQRAWVYTVWVPHWRDNPFMYLPGPEFAYPNEDQQPRNTYIHWRARGQRNYAWNNQPGLPGTLNGPLLPYDGVADSRFGAMLPFCWRTGAAIGKRLNIVAIGIGSTPLAVAHVTNNASGIFTGTVGWWNHERFGYGLQLEDSTSYMAKRLKRLITFMAPNALLAESNTKELRFLAACHIQGEADGFSEAGREHYRSLITDFREWLRDLVIDNSWNPFEGDAKMPFAQPLISYDEYMAPAGLAWNDREGEINNAIREMHTAEEFSGYVLVDDLPKENLGHYSGGGMAVLGARLAVSVLDNLEHALSFGSAALVRANTRLLRVANLALVYIGQGANPITSLSATSTEAELIRLMLPQAIEKLLSMRQWSFAMRVEPAAKVTHQHPLWLHCYVVPGRAITPVEVVPPPTMPPEGATAGTGERINETSPALAAEREALAAQGGSNFVVEASPSGHRVIYTDVDQIDPNLLTPVPAPNNELMPVRLPTLPRIRYVDKQFDPDRFSPDFLEALSLQLASMIAAPLVKGQEGAALKRTFSQDAAAAIRSAAGQESAQDDRPTSHTAPWMSAR